MKDRNGAATFAAGVRDGMPIAIGYFAVSFTLGIQAKSAGLTVLEAAFMSLVNLTSAGQFAAISIIGAAGSYLSVALSQLIINLRYMLMSFALSQKVEPELGVPHRMGIAFGVTDEIFGISIGLKERLKPAYSYGAMIVAIPGWTIGTALGVIMGNILPGMVVNALNLALYAMFVAIVVPVAEKDRKVALAAVVSCFMSFVCTRLPVVRDIASGTRIIILTVIIALIFAVLFPVKEENGNES